MSNDHAVIAGAGMAGLLSGAALLEHYDTVTFVEADQFVGDEPEEAEAGMVSGRRRGTPQAGQAHILLARGAGAIEELVPGVTEDLVAAGASVVPARMGSQQGFRLVSPVGSFAEASSEATFLGVSRPLLERTLRARVLAHPRVRLCSGRTVQGLAADSSVMRVHGMHLAGDDGRSQMLPADLVVDATGRRSAAPRWLEALGLPRVEETVTHPRVGYASRTYRRPPSPSAGWDGALINARPGVNPRFGILLPTENGTCAVGLGGFAGHYPPADPEGFLAWAAALSDPCLHEALLESEPLDAPQAYRTPSSTFRHFERLPGHPSGFVAVGDAVAAFNPVYGQGMSVAALDALALRDAHRSIGAADPADRARSAIAALTAGPWALAAGQDRAWDPRPRTRSARLRHGVEDGYLRAVQSGATRDPAIAAAFAEVMMMLAEPATLTRPALLARVARRALLPTRRPRSDSSTGRAESELAGA